MQITHEQNMGYATRIPRSFWYSVAFVTLSLILFGVWIALTGTSPLFPLQAKIGLTLVSLASFVLSLVGIKRTPRSAGGGGWLSSLWERRRSWSILAFCIFLAAQGVGNVLYVYNYSHNIFAFPSWGDGTLLLVGYPALFAGILCLPVHSSAGKSRTRAVLDSLLLICAIIALSWYFTLGPTVLSVTDGSLLTILASLGYPTFDLLLIICIILFAMLYSVRVPRTVIALLTTMLVISAITDAYASFCIMQQQIYLSAWPNLGWAIAMFVLALTVQAMRWPIAEEAAEESSSAATASFSAVPLWRVLLPYSLVFAVLALVVYVWKSNQGGLLTLGTYACGVILLIVIFIRQFFTIQETNRLNSNLIEARHELSEKNDALEHANDRLELLATTDPLTELPNHRALLATLTSEIERAQRYERSCTLLFFDIDHFKALNDSYGHAAGDEALIAFGQRLRRTARGIDTVGRWGGEEFLAILPETSIIEAQALAERIHIEVSQQPLAIGGGIHVTCSIGLASYPSHAGTLDVLINAADQAMYAAKRLGRNQHRVIDDPAVQLVLASEESKGGREETALNGIVTTLVSLMEQRDGALGGHVQDVADLVEQIARRMGIEGSEARMIHIAGQLHDLGKIGVPDAILQKPAQLTAEEWQQIKRHPGIGAEVIANVPSLRPLGPAIRAHHERWDGMGYPDQLQGEHIPFAARVIAVADAYMAMISDRPYRRACSPSEALGELRRCSGTQFDPSVVEVLAALLAEQASQQRVVLSDVETDLLQLSQVGGAA